MAIRYNDNFNPTLNYGNAQLDTTTSHVATPGLMGGRLRYKVATWTQTNPTVALDQQRLFSMKSSDIMVSLTISCPAASGATTVDFGFRYPNEGGLVIGPTGSISEVSTVADAVDLAGSDLRTQVLFDPGATDEGERIGMANWQLVDAGTATYLVDPCETWELTLSYIGAATGTPLTHVECTYVAT
jgi:hypothetical protein